VHVVDWELGGAGGANREGSGGGGLQAQEKDLWW